jgi:hypothetical protein
MAINKEQIRKALDHFENDEFTDAKDILSKEVASSRDEFLKDKLDLKKDVNEETEYQKFFKSKLKEFGVSSPAELKDDEKKKFFDEVDAEYKGKKEED